MLKRRALTDASGCTGGSDYSDWRAHGARRWQPIGADGESA